MDEVTEFNQGLEHDPEQATTPSDSDSRVTRALSWWHYRWCTQCGHTFRRDDQVLVDDATRTVRHLKPSLGCATADPADSDGADIQEFLAGMQETWPVEHQVPTSFTEDQPLLLAPPLGSGRRMTCLGCGHTFRPHETVIVCPCQPNEPRCRHAVHRDPGLGLVCWENWRPSGQLEVCPVTLRKLA